MRLKNDDMADILNHLQQYVPMNSIKGEIVDPDDGEVVKITVDEFHYTLFGGDQLTAERATGAKRSLTNENRGRDRLEGLVPVIEDWHANVCLLKVCLSHIIFVMLHYCFYSQYGKYCTRHHRVSILVLFSNYVTYCREEP